MRGREQLFDGRLDDLFDAGELSRTIENDRTLADLPIASEIGSQQLLGQEPLTKLGFFEQGGRGVEARRPDLVPRAKPAWSAGLGEELEPNMRIVCRRFPNTAALARSFVALGGDPVAVSPIDLDESEAVPRLELFTQGTHALAVHFGEHRFLEPRRLIDDGAKVVEATAAAHLDDPE